MSVDISKISVGDEVTIYGKVERVDPKGGHRQIRVEIGPNEFFWTRTGAIVGHVPASRPIVEDCLVVDRNGSEWRVLAVREGYAWCIRFYSDGHIFGSFPVEKLTIIDAPAEGTDNAKQIQEASP